MVARPCERVQSPRDAGEPDAAIRVPGGLAPTSLSVLRSAWRRRPCTPSRRSTPACVPAMRLRLVVPSAVAVLALTAASARAQHAGHHGTAADTGKAAHTASGWKEMDAFHQLMMATRHPAQGKGDLAPTRAQAGAMADAARTWAAAAVPKACDTPATRTALTALATDSRALAELAAKPATADAELKAALKALHDRFEPLEHGCAPAGAKKAPAAHGAHPSH